VEPGLIKTKGSVDAFEHFCFADDYVFANHVEFSIQLKCPFGFTGGIKAIPLLPWLSTTKAKGDLVIDQTKDKVTFKAGKHRVTCSTFPVEDFIEPEPIDDSTVIGEIPFNDAFKKVIKLASKYAGNNAAKPELVSFTFYLGKVSKLYTTDEVTMTRFDLPKMGVKEDFKLVIPTRFFETLITISESMPKEKVTIKFGKDFVEGVVGDTAKIFTQLYLTESDTLIDFPEIFKTAIGKESKMPLVSIPAGLNETLKLSSIVSEEGDSGWAELQIKDKKITIKSNSSTTHGVESLKFKGTHPDINIKHIKPNLAYKGIEDTSEFCALEDCLIFKGEGMLYLVSNGLT